MMRDIAPVLRTGLIMSPPNHLGKSNEQIVYIIPRNIDFSKDSPEDRVRSLLFFLQRDLESPSIQEGGFMLICDMAGAGLNPNIPAQKAMISVVQEAMPAKAKKILIVNGGWILGVVFGAIKPLLSQKIQNRIQILKNPKEIFNFVDPANLLTTLGGTLDFDHLAYIEEEIKRQEQTT